MWLCDRRIMQTSTRGGVHGRRHCAELRSRSTVCLATDPSERCGYVVAIILVPPYEALVRWREGSTFEALDNLVEVNPQRSGVH